VLDTDWFKRVLNKSRTKIYAWKNHFFVVDDLPMGALARYERDVAAMDHVLKQRAAQRCPVQS